MYAMNRTNGRGLLFHLMEIHSQSTKISCGNKHMIVPYNIHEISQAWYNWQMRGEKIQNAFAFMKPEEREFLITALTPEEWKELMIEEEY